MRVCGGAALWWTMSISVINYFHRNKCGKKKKEKKTRKKVSPVLRLLTDVVELSGSSRPGEFTIHYKDNSIYFLKNKKINKTSDQLLFSETMY